MPAPKSSYNISFHKGSGQACLVIARKRIYLGKWPGGPDAPLPPEVRARFSQEVAKAALGEAPGRPSKEAAPAAGLLLSELVAAWLEWARGRYTLSDSIAPLHWATRPLVELFGPEPASSVGPKRIRQAQELMARQGRTRQGINLATSYIRQLFAWGVAQELIQPDQLVAVRSLQALRKGAIQAKESAPIALVPLETVQATLPHLSPTVAAMVRLQMLTGMRPAEVCNLSMPEIDRVSKDKWIYRPSAHKTAHLGRERAVPLLADAIALLLPFVRADGLPLFSPADAREAWEADKRAKRKTKVQPSQMDRHKEAPQVVPGDRYETASYRRAIARACKRAKVDPWSPNRLRKLAAQCVADSIGLNAARALLGHSDDQVTRQHYARLELDAATVAARALASKLAGG